MGKITRDLSCMVQEPLKLMQDEPSAGNQASALSAQHAISLVLHGWGPAHQLFSPTARGADARTG